MASLEDKYNALETVYKLGYALDALNYPAMAALFYPDKKFNFDIYDTLKVPPKDVTPAECFQMAGGSLGGFDYTQHSLTSPVVTLNGNDKAHVKVQCYAYHLIENEGAMTVRVSWDFDLDKNGSNWFITKWKLGIIVPMDRPDLMKRAHDRAESGQKRASMVGP